MLRTRLVEPYTATGRAVFPERARPGVYLIFRAGVLRYVGYSRSDVYKALYRHFQRWSDGSRPYPRATYPKANGTKVRVIYTTNPGQASRLERALIVRFRPLDNPSQLSTFDLSEQDRNELASAAASPWADLGPAPF